MNGLGHFLWFIFTILSGGFALPFWILAALIYGSGRRKRDRELMERQTKAIEEMNRINSWKGYRD